jgi:hypothetical protein
MKRKQADTTTPVGQLDQDDTNRRKSARQIKRVTKGLPERHLAGLEAAGRAAEIRQGNRRKSARQIIRVTKDLPERHLAGLEAAGRAAEMEVEEEGEEMAEANR